MINRMAKACLNALKYIFKPSLANNNCSIKFLFMSKIIFKIVCWLYLVIRLHRSFIFPATIWNAFDVNSFFPLDTHKPFCLRKIASVLVELSSTENVNKRQTQPAVPAEQLVLSSYLWNPVWWNNWMKFFEV